MKFDIFGGRAFYFSRWSSWAAEFNLSDERYRYFYSLYLLRLRFMSSLIYSSLLFPLIFSSSACEACYWFWVLFWLCVFLFASWLIAAKDVDRPMTDLTLFNKPCMYSEVSDLIMFLFLCILTVALPSISWFDTFASILLQWSYSWETLSTTISGLDSL